MTQEPHARPRRSPALRLARRLAATGSLIALILIVGVISQGLWHPIIRQPWLPLFAYGVPSFEQGYWWTPITGTFLVLRPAQYFIAIIGFAGMAFVEYRRGARFALTYFVGGQLFAVVGTSLFVWLSSLTGWMWAVELSHSLDVGASGGTMACVAAAAGLLPAPWRQRLWTLILVYGAVAVLYIGTFADVAHAFAIVLILFIDRSLRVRRTSPREQRLLAFWVMCGLVASEVIALVIPTAGPFGHSEPLSGGWFDVATDVAISAVAAHGLRIGRRWAWILSLILSGLNAIVGIALLLVRLFTPEVIGDHMATVNMGLSSSVLWIMFGIALIIARDSFRTRGARRFAGQSPLTSDQVRSYVRSHGGGNLSWMATWDGFQHLRTASGMVAFQRHMGVAIALGDPLGDPATAGTSAREFIAKAEDHSLIPCFFSATKLTQDAVPAGWRSLVVAEDTIVDLPGINFQGKPRARVRQSFSRAERDGVVFRLSRWEEESWGVRQQIRAISEGWVGERDLPELRFTLGTLAEAEDPEVRLGIAIAPNGDVDGFVSWLPVYNHEGTITGWTLDLMRRREGGLPVVMEFLIGSSAIAFDEEGALTLSLSGAPFAHVAEPEDGTIANLLERFAQAIEPVYGFRSLHKFKEKFTPRYEPMYLLYRDEGDLARIAAALTRAFLPDASLPQLAAAGLSLRDGGK